MESCLRSVGDKVRCTSRLHGPGVGVVTKVTRWRHKVFYHMDWTWDPGDRMVSRERAGKDDCDWEQIAGS
jgi:hypothetical protein